MKLFLLKIRKQNGQTLLETVVGIFIMVMGITAALGLANYSFSASSGIVNQLIGMGLAREGMEAVKNMRDTNWLKGTYNANGCYNFTTGTNNAAPCYTDWQNVSGGYNIQANPSQKVFTLDFNPAATDSSTYWILNNENTRFALNIDATASSGRIFYPSGATTGNSKYYRKIIITEDSPYSADPLMRRLIVTTQVWWKDKGCPNATDWAATSPKCRIELTTYLTNWRNY